MSDPASTPTSSPSKAYNCPNCERKLQSIYHTVCPVCAEPIGVDFIRNHFGEEAFLAVWRMPGHRGKRGRRWWKFGAGAFVALGAVAVVLAMVV